MTLDLEAIKARCAEYADHPGPSFGPDTVMALVAELERLRGEISEIKRITEESIARIEAEHGAGDEWCENPVRGAVSSAMGLLRCRIALAVTGKEKTP